MWTKTTGFGYVCVSVCVCVCVEGVHREYTGQNLPMRYNKRCLRSMSECPYISAVGAESLQSAGKGQPILESVLFSASKSSGCLWAAAVKYITKASSWGTLSQSKQASGAWCSKYEPVIWSLRFFSYQTNSFTFQASRFMSISHRRAEKYLHKKTIVWVLDPDHHTFEICMKHKQMNKDLNRYRGAKLRINRNANWGVGLRWVYECEWPKINMQYLL